jgi:nucleoid DNA-binding protein
MGKLTIQEVAKILVEKNGLNQREANQFATECFAVILNRLQDGDAVKVKGLGTFKIINVEARESVSVRTGERVVIDSHSKVSFTPDMVMKELVNKPFSQFETVVLNDGVEFEDIPDDVTEEESSVVEEPAMEGPVIIEEKNIVAEEPSDEEPPVEELVSEEPVVEEPSVEDPVAGEPEELINFYEEELPEERHWGRWLLAGLVVLALILAAGYGGYEYGRQQTAVLPDTVFVRDTVYMTETQDSVEVGESEETIANEITATPVAKEEPKEAPKAEPKVEPKKEEVDQWSAKDERVRLGAYRIVGLSHEVTVLEGQTFYSICRAHLGPDMQCYVEVFNGLPQNPQIKTGQVLKIPKLELKKRRK